MARASGPEGRHDHIGGMPVEGLLPSRACAVEAEDLTQALG
jgi:hypothetical protein